MTKIGDWTMPKLIEVVQRPGTWSLRVDGVEFPWVVADGMEFTVGNHGACPGVRLTLMADEVRVVHSLEAPKEAAK